MGQLYMQRFEYRGGISKTEYDAAWGIANDVMARTGNWGGVRAGLKHLHAFGTSWGGYALLDVDDPQALAEYQLFHVNNYAHLVTITLDPVINLDAAIYSK